MPSPVYFINMRARQGLNLFDKIERLFKKSSLKQFVTGGDLLAVKIHFGEDGNLSYIHPRIVRFIIEQLKKYNTKPFLTDANSLYAGSRGEAVGHLQTAIGNGFDYSVVGAPLIISDGLRGSTATKIEINLNHFKEVMLGSEVCHADKMICLTHFKCHELTGFGGAIKNVGMGLASRAGKLAMHSTLNPYISEDCVACGVCLKYCGSGAIKMSEGEKKAYIDDKACIGCGECLISCPQHRIKIRWNESVANFQEKICEYAYGLLVKRKLPCYYVNFINNLSPVCDCYPYSDTAITPDIGILASYDPVAIDQASADLVINSPGIKGTALNKSFAPGDDKFRDIYPHIDWEVQLAYGEKIGLGRRQYQLINIFSEE
ncbi:MAG: DUF362 domain-containing protein [Candidatus Schekmanbacteria bacterium]|nr:DUF362 domain-containing protein [Candidatus Schekmanbacteria bacterium]